MATKQGTFDFIVEQASGAGRVSARKMFGEYALYCDGKLVALVCDEQLFLKPMASGRATLGDEVTEMPPYPGAKACFRIPGETWDDADRLPAPTRCAPAQRGQAPPLDPADGGMSWRSGRPVASSCGPSRYGSRTACLPMPFGV